MQFDNLKFAIYIRGVDIDTPREYLQDLFTDAGCIPYRIDFTKPCGTKNQTPQFVNGVRKYKGEQKMVYMYFTEVNYGLEFFSTLFHQNGSGRGLKNNRGQAMSTKWNDMDIHVNITPKTIEESKEYETVNKIYYSGNVRYYEKRVKELNLKVVVEEPQEMVTITKEEYDALVKSRVKIDVLEKEYTNSIVKIKELENQLVEKQDKINELDLENQYLIMDNEIREEIIVKDKMEVNGLKLIVENNNNEITVLTDKLNTVLNINMSDLNNIKNLVMRVFGNTNEDLKDVIKNIYDEIHYVNIRLVNLTSLNIHSHLMNEKEFIYKKHFKYDLSFPIDVFINCFLDFYNDQIIINRQTDEDEIINDVGELELN
jgi:hypothetical protein